MRTNIISSVGLKYGHQNVNRAVYTACLFDKFHKFHAGLAIKAKTCRRNLSWLWADRVAEGQMSPGPLLTHLICHRVNYNRIDTLMRGNIRISDSTFPHGRGPAIRLMVRAWDYRNFAPLVSLLRRR